MHLGVASWGRDIESLRRVLDEWGPGDAVVKVTSVEEGAVVQAAVMPNAAEPGAAGRWSKRKEVGFLSAYVGSWFVR